MKQSKIDNLPAPSDLFELLELDATSGKLTWKNRDVKWFTDGPRLSARGKCAIWNGRFAGAEALGAPTSAGYKDGQIGCVRVLAHHVVWAMTHGYWPTHEVDHADRDQSNNAPCNLRAATRSQNTSNTVKQKREGRGASTYRGVYKHGRGWAASISANGKSKYLGTFDTQREAAERWDEEARKRSGDFAVLNCREPH